MTREEKTRIIEEITEKVNRYPHFYLTDATGLNAADTSNFRRMCFNENIEVVVVKNTLLKKAFERSGKTIEGIDSALKQQSAVMFTEIGNAPAKLLKKFRGKDKTLPILKGAFVEECVYLGESSLDSLIAVKSKKELIADVILMLQSPIQNLVSQLNSAPNTIAGITKTLSEKEN
jgi:large subunit ribosomal protein L10